MVRRYLITDRIRRAAMTDNSETKWEYHLEMKKNLSGELGPSFLHRAESTFKELGEQGWEFVAFSEKEGIFKRRKASEDGPQSIFEE